MHSILIKFAIAVNASVIGFMDEHDLDVYLGATNGTVDLAIYFRELAKPNRLSYTLQFGFVKMDLSERRTFGTVPRTKSSQNDVHLLFPIMSNIFEVNLYQITPYIYIYTNIYQSIHHHKSLVYSYYSPQLVYPIPLKATRGLP